MRFSMAQGSLLGDAVDGQVLVGVKYQSAKAGYSTGTMPADGSPQIYPSTADQGIAAGNYTGGLVHAVTGTATVADIWSGLTASSAAGIGLVGTLAVKMASGSATSAGATSLFNKYGGGTQGLYPLSIPVPAGAREIIGVFAAPMGGLTWMGAFGTPLGGLNGQPTALQWATVNSSGGVFLVAGAPLQMDLSAITVGVSEPTAPCPYVVLYV